MPSASIEQGLRLLHAVTAATMRPPTGAMLQWYAETFQSKAGRFLLTEALVRHVLDATERALVYEWKVTSDVV